MLKSRGRGQRGSILTAWCKKLFDSFTGLHHFMFQEKSISWWANWFLQRTGSVLKELPLLKESHDKFSVMYILPALSISESCPLFVSSNFLSLFFSSQRHCCTWLSDVWQDQPVNQSVWWHTNCDMTVVLWKCPLSGIYQDNMKWIKHRCNGKTLNLTEIFWCLFIDQGKIKIKA